MIGIVTLWQNRGQAQVSRQIRSIYDDAGFKTFILARPSPEIGTMPGLIKDDGVWDAAGVTHGTQFEMPFEEYAAWVEANQIKLIVCDMNFQFGVLARLRRELKVAVVGRFVWERFTATHAQRARAAYDVVYSLTRAEQQNYRRLGLPSPHLRWGIHPEFAHVTPNRANDYIDFVFHGGMLGRRKPIESVLRAFERVPGDHLRLTIKSQATHREAESTVTDDPRVTNLQADLDFDEYQQLMADAHVCIGVSRWEGLGVHFFEATAYGTPTIASKMPPADEFIKDNVNGLLVAGSYDGYLGNGLPMFEPDRDALTRAIGDLARPARWRALHRSTLAMRERFDWETTRADYLRLAQPFL